jgi:hypothetical protein
LLARVLDWRSLLVVAVVVGAYAVHPERLTPDLRLPARATQMCIDRPKALSG